MLLLAIIHIIKGAVGHREHFSELTYYLFIIEGSDIHELLLVPTKNIVPSSSVLMDD